MLRYVYRQGKRQNARDLKSHEPITSRAFTITQFSIGDNYLDCSLRDPRITRYYYIPCIILHNSFIYPMHFHKHGLFISCAFSKSTDYLYPVHFQKAQTIYIPCILKKHRLLSRAFSKSTDYLYICVIFI